MNLEETLKNLGERYQSLEDTYSRETNHYKSALKELKETYSKKEQDYEEKINQLTTTNKN